MYKCLTWFCRVLSVCTSVVILTWFCRVPSVCTCVVFLTWFCRVLSVCTSAVFLPMLSRTPHSLGAWAVAHVWPLPPTCAVCRNNKQSTFTLNHTQISVNFGVIMYCNVLISCFKITHTIIIDFKLKQTIYIFFITVPLMVHNYNEAVLNSILYQ